jgi:hypothetical protein
MPPHIFAASSYPLPKSIGKGPNPEIIPDILPKLIQSLWLHYQKNYN